MEMIFCGSNMSNFEVLDEETETRHCMKARKRRVKFIRQLLIVKHLTREITSNIKYHDLKRAALNKNELFLLRGEDLRKYIESKMKM